MVILDLQSGEYYGVDLIGTRIWAMLDQRMSAPAILKQLLAEYDVDDQTCRNHLGSFFRQLEQNNLVVIREFL